MPRELTFELIEKYVDDIVTVSDEEIASTILLLLERAKPGSRRFRCGKFSSCSLSPGLIEK